MKLYDKSKIDFNNLMYTNHDLTALLIPLIFEQLLNSFMGMADTVMVSNVGSAAISAVSLVDSINNLIIQVFSALATGGTIICSHFLGQGNRRQAVRSAEQVVLVVFALSLSLSLLCMVLKQPLLHLIFGSVEADVMRGAIIYFQVTLISFPFLSLFSAGSAFFRAFDNSRFPMIISIIGNVMNIAGNALLIFGLGMGIEGAALSTLFSRIFCFVAIFVALRNPHNAIYIRKYFHIRPNGKLIHRILNIGIPSGIENGMFQFGKLAIQSSVSTLPTTAIAAQAMTIIFESLNGISGIAIGIGLMTVVGQTLGAGRHEEAKYYIVRLSWIAEISIVIACILTYLVAFPITSLADMEPESRELCLHMLGWISLVKPVVWTMSFVPAYGLRAAGDVKFSMIVGSITMWTCRVAICVFLIRVMGFGPMAVWIGMFADWTLRGIIYSIRFLSGKWLNHEVV